MEAIAKLRAAGRQCELVLVGDGDGRSAIEAAIVKHRVADSVRLLGWGDGEKVRDTILSARALVVPSFAENLPVVIMEAMALGRPVIATTIAGIPELVVPGENGWLVPAGDTDALAAALGECLDTPDGRLAAMGAAGRRRVAERHDADTEAATLSNLFNANQAPQPRLAGPVRSSKETREGLSWEPSDAPSPTYSNA